MCSPAQVTSHLGTIFTLWVHLRTLSRAAAAWACNLGLLLAARVGNGFLFSGISAALAPLDRHRWEWGCGAAQQPAWLPLLPDELLLSMPTVFSLHAAAQGCNALGDLLQPVGAAHAKLCP